MVYSEKVDLEVEKAARISVHNDYDMLKGCVNRIFVTDDISELFQMYNSAKRLIDMIYEYHENRVRQLENISGEIE